MRCFQRFLKAFTIYWHVHYFGHVICLFKTTVFFQSKTALKFPDKMPVASKEMFEIAIL